MLMLICSQIETVLLFGIYTFGVITCLSVGRTIHKIHSRWMDNWREECCKVAEAFVEEQQLKWGAWNKFEWMNEWTIDESRRLRLDYHCYGPSFGEHFSLHFTHVKLRKKESNRQLKIMSTLEFKFFFSLLSSVIQSTFSISHNRPLTPLFHSCWWRWEFFFFFRWNDRRPSDPHTEG